MLPLDGHVHSEWSWDAVAGDMEATCARAVELGLPAVAFTEHVDHTRWLVSEGTEPDPRARGDRAPGTFTAGPLDVDGYLESLERCRERFPSLHLLSGVELGEPHWHADAVAHLLAAGPFERVLGSLHSLPDDAAAAEPPSSTAAARRRRSSRATSSSSPRWSSRPASSRCSRTSTTRCATGRARPGRSTSARSRTSFRHVLRTLAGGDRVLEVNTKGPMLPEVVRWWREEGGRVVTFGSDAHRPELLGRRLAEAVAMVEAYGFRAGRHPYDRWTLPG